MKMTVNVFLVVKALATDFDQFHHPPSAQGSAQG